MAARPQLENGYTRLANEILEALARTRIPGEARQVLDVILRKTYGYGKKSDRIPLSQFEVATGLSRQGLCRGLRTLDSMNLINRFVKAGATEYAFCKDFSKWRELTDRLKLTNPLIASHRSVNKPKRIRDTQKKKETSSKEKPPLSKDAKQKKAPSRPKDIGGNELQDLSNITEATQ